MSRFLNQLISGSSSSEPQAIHAFSMRPTPRDAKCILVHPFGYPLEAPPLYSIHKSETAKPDILFYYGSPEANQVIADATLSSFSSKTKLTLRGMPLVMKTSNMSGNFTVTGTSFGELKWKHSEMSGSLEGLYDAQGVKLAKIKSEGLSGGKRLEVLVQCDQSLIDLVVFTGLVARLLDKKSIETAAEVIDATAGM